MVKVENIFKSFGKTEVLKGVSLTVEQGEIITIIGPSGTGKTTLLRCINYLEHPDAGSVTINDVTVSGPHPHKKDILALRRKSAMVFQSHNLFNNKTVLENVMEGPVVVKKIPKAEARKRAIEELERVGMADKIDAYPSQISGGQQQRVGIARALAMDPEIVLFDEPTSALDPELSREVLNTIRNVAKRGITMLIVTHEIAFAQEISTSIVFMDGGVVVEQGPPEQIFHAPRQERTAQFLKRISSDA